jgi:tetratricopeptide (TPR) repeat protein
VKKITITVVILVISLIITAFLFFINDIVISIRLDELSAKLLEKNRTESSMDHIGLIATYQINKNIFEKKFSQEDADALELKVMSLSKSEERDSPDVIQTKYKIISQPALLMINFNRNIIGKAPLTYRQSPDQHVADLDVAYYYERNFLFSRAITLYDKVLENRNMDSTLKAGILLHQGYCYALAGLNDKAMHNYTTIINKYGNENSAITAAILSRYLEGFKLAREKVLRSNTDPILRSQDLVNLLAYGQALKILEEEERRASPGDIPRIKYFKARCFTGIGEPEKAAENYLDVIVSSPSSQYARYSNRKLFLIGSRAGGENDIVRLSEQLNSRLEDPVLLEMIKNQKYDTKPADNVTNLEKLNISKLFLEKAGKFAEEKKKSEPVSKYYIILTSDGNTFKGTLIEQDDKEIALQTSIGRINVKRDKITSITIK